MMMRSKAVLLLLSLLLVAVIVTAAAAAATTVIKPVDDSSYLQPLTLPLNHSSGNLTQVASLSARWGTAVVQNGAELQLLSFKTNELRSMAALLPKTMKIGATSRFAAFETTLVVATPNALWVCPDADFSIDVADAFNCSSTAAAFGAVARVVHNPDAQTVLVAAASGLFTCHLTWPHVVLVDDELRDVRAVAVYGNEWLAYGNNEKLVVVNTATKAKRWWWVSSGVGRPAKGSCVSGNVTSLAFDMDGRVLWIGTPRAVDMMSMATMDFRRLDGYRGGMPMDNVTDIAVATGWTTASQVFFATPSGLVRFDATYMSASNEQMQRWHYYNSNRYLRDSSDVVSLAVVSDDPAAGVLVATRAELLVLRLVPFTLADKMASLQSIVNPRHNRHGLVSDCGLKKFGDLTTWFSRSSDNDGLHTAIYTVSQALRYLVTKDESVRAAAWTHFEALEFLNNVTGIKGMFARSVVTTKEVLPKDGRWWNSTVYPGWIWKGDTSSDEVTGHMFAYAVTYDVLAKSDNDRARVLRVLENFVGGAIEHGFKLIGGNGEPTEWGHWDPKDLNVNMSWVDDRGLNSLEFVTWALSAYRLTNNATYLGAVKYLVQENQYGWNLITQLVEYENDITWFDHRLGWNTFHLLTWTLNRMTPDQIASLPQSLTQNFFTSMQRSWIWSRPERSSYFNLVYVVARTTFFNQSQFDSSNPLDPTDVDLQDEIDKGVETLRRWTADAIDWPVHNSQRSDVFANPYDASRSTRALPHGEIFLSRWSDCPYTMDRGSGVVEFEPTAPLIAYWGMRHYGYLSSASSSS